MKAGKITITAKVGECEDSYELEVVKTLEPSVTPDKPGVGSGTDSNSNTISGTGSNSKPNAGTNTGLSASV